MWNIVLIKTILRTGSGMPTFSILNRVAGGKCRSRRMGEEKGEAAQTQSRARNKPRAGICCFHDLYR